MAPSRSSKRKDSPDSSALDEDEVEGHYVLYPSGGAFNKKRQSKENEHLNCLLAKNITAYSKSKNRRDFIVSNILSQLPGGLYVWDKEKNHARLLDEEEAYNRLTQRIRDMKKTLRPLPPREVSKRKAPKTKIAQDHLLQQKAKMQRMEKTEGPPLASPRQSPARGDITPDHVKDELIVALRSEILRLRQVVRDQGMELQALRTLKGNPSLTGLPGTDSTSM